MPSRPDSASCPVCECQFGDSDCIHISGTGQIGVDPYQAAPNLNPDTDNLLEDGPAGFAAFAPYWLINPPAVLMYATVNNSIAYDAAQGLFFNEVRYDTDSMADTVESRITFKTPGVYLVTLNVRWKKQIATQGDVSALIGLNGAEYIASDASPYGEDDLYNSHSLSIEWEFETGDFINAFVRQDAYYAPDDDRLIGVVLAEYRLPSFGAIFLRPPT